MSCSLGVLSLSTWTRFKPLLDFATKPWGCVERVKNWVSGAAANLLDRPSWARSHGLRDQEQMWYQMGSGPEAPSWKLAEETEQ